MKKQLGHYEIVSELGRGGMGVVYKAHEQSLNRFVALKVLSDRVAGNTELLARFKREAVSAAGLNHPNIVQVYFFGEDEGQHFFVMEYVEGESLSERIRREQKMDPKQAARILIQAASGLAAAHDRKIIHRDIKPANLMINNMGIVKIADFGIAHIQDPDEKLTATGQFLGTPGYLSPEVCLGEGQDHRTDIFSLGIVFFEMLTGATPFKADSPLAMLRQVVETEVPDPRISNARVDAGAHRMLTRMTAKKRDDRYPDCHALIADLQAYLAGDRTEPGMAAALGQAVVHGGASPYEARTVASAGRTVLDTAPTEVVGPPPPPTVAPPLPAASAPPPLMSSAPPPFHAAEASKIPSVRIEVAPAPTRKKRSALPWILVAAMLLLAAGVWAGYPQIRDFLENLQDKGGSDSVAANDTTNWPENDGTNIDPTQIEEDPGSLQANEDVFPNETGQDADGITGNEGAGPGAIADSSDFSGGDPAAAGKQGGNPGDTSAVGPTKGYDAGPTESKTEGYEAAQVTYEKVRKQPNGGSDAGETTENAAKVNSFGIKVKTRKPVLLPEDPLVAVVTAGDPLLTDWLAQHLDSLIGKEGFRVMDRDRLPNAYRNLSDSPDLMEVAGAVRNAEGDVLVLVEAVPVSQRQLQFSGRSMTAWKARVRIKCFFPDGDRKLGEDMLKEVEYTNLNAARKGEDMALAVIDDLIGYLRGP